MGLKNKKLLQTTPNKVQNGVPLVNASLTNQDSASQTKKALVNQSLTIKQNIFINQERSPKPPSTQGEASDK